MSEAQSKVNKAVSGVVSQQGKFASAKGEKPQKEAGHGSAKSGGVGGKLVPGKGGK